MGNIPILIIVAVLAACQRPPSDATERPQPADAAAATPEPATEQIPPVLLGRRPPDTPMTSDNMPLFDTVTYCQAAARKVETVTKGPIYAACVQLQEDTRIVVGKAINTGQFDEAVIVRCAKSSRTAYQGMWYCMNGRPNAE
jgi:hypothetical protein